MTGSLNLLVVGVGGQGVVLASDIIGEAALSAGYDVKKTDTLGMAQRGGSVISQVRLAEKVWSPLISEGGSDIILGFEKIESARWLSYLRPEGVVIINNHAIPPLSVTAGAERYPANDEILGAMRQLSHSVYLVEGTNQVKELGNLRTLNIFMIGCASVFMPLNVLTWKDCISRAIPERVRDINLAAFDLGRSVIAAIVQASQQRQV